MQVPYGFRCQGDNARNERYPYVVGSVVVFFTRRLREIGEQVWIFLRLLKFLFEVLLVIMILMTVEVEVLLHHQMFMVMTLVTHILELSSFFSLRLE